MSQKHNQLLFEAGRAAANRDWLNAQVVGVDTLDDQTPTGPPLIIAASSKDVTVRTAKDLAALAGSGRDVLLVTDQRLGDDVAPWLPANSLVIIDNSTTSNPEVSEHDHLHKRELQTALLTPLLADATVRYALASSSNTPPPLVTRIASEWPDSRPTSALASNPSTPVDFLNKLLDTNDPDVLFSLAANSALPLSQRQDLMRRLATMKIAEWDAGDEEYEEWILNEVAELPADVFALLNQAGYLYGEWVYNESIPAELLLKIITEFKTESYQEPGFASRSSTPTWVLHHLAASENEWIRMWAAMPPDSPPDLLHSLSLDPSEQVRTWVALNPSVPTETLVRMLDDVDNEVRWAATVNTRLPLHLARTRESEIMAWNNFNHDVVRCVQTNRISAHALTILASESSFHHAIAESHSTPVETLIQLASGAGATAVAHNPAAPESLRAELLRREIASAQASDPLPLMRIAREKQSPPEILEMLLQHPHPVVRAYAIINPTTPQSLLEAAALRPA